MHVVINQFDDDVGYYKLFDLEGFNKRLTKKKNVQGTVIFATSKIQHDKTEHCNCTKNKKPQSTTIRPNINPFTFPVESEETKVSFRMPLEDFPRNNFTTIILAAFYPWG